MAGLDINYTYEKAYEQKYKNYDEKFAKAKAIYVKEEQYLYHDFELTEPVKESELEDLFFSDVVIINGDYAFFRPSEYRLDEKMIYVADGRYYGCVPETTEES